MSLLRRSSASSSPTVAVDRREAGWSYIDFAAYRLAGGETLSGETGDREVALILLGGSATIVAGRQRWELTGGRQDVWEWRPPYVVLLPPGSDYQVTAGSAVHLAVAGAPASPSAGAPSPGRPRLIAPAEIVAEERGDGQTRRHIHHLLPPSAPAARLILVEVYTPGGNWSSFPPHKHDTEDPPAESYLEEIYYYQINPPSGFALQRVYTDEGSLDEALAPGDGDLVLVPAGYHPVAATPGHDCYYLNVMAGPTRSWNFRPAPAYLHLMNWQKPDVAKG